MLQAIFVPSGLSFAIIRMARVEASFLFASTSPKFEKPIRKGQNTIEYSVWRVIEKGRTTMTIDINKMRERLEAKRAELQGNASGLNQAHPTPVDYITANEGDKDQGDDAVELQEIETERAVLVNEDALLIEVQNALDRILNGTYGICITCGKPIPEKRLEAIPWASRDVKCEAQLERRNLSREDILFTESNVNNTDMYPTNPSEDDLLLP